MRALIALIVACAGFVGAPVMAEDGRDPFPRYEPGQVFRSLVRERDVTLFFDYLRGSFAAALEGQQAPPPPEELSARAEALSHALKAQAAIAALTLLDALERRAQQALREAPRPQGAPSRSFTPLQE